MVVHIHQPGHDRGPAQIDHLRFVPAQLQGISAERDDFPFTDRHCCGGAVSRIQRINGAIENNQVRGCVYECILFDRVPSRMACATSGGEAGNRPSGAFILAKSSPWGVGFARRIGCHCTPTSHGSAGKGMFRCLGSRWIVPHNLLATCVSPLATACRLYKGGRTNAKGAHLEENPHGPDQRFRNR